MESKLESFPQVQTAEVTRVPSQSAEVEENLTVIMFIICKDYHRRCVQNLFSSPVSCVQKSGRA